ncbi:NAD(P)/FAD-dependent oxidoreductase [Nocardia sp. NPDC048505]|uniref:NAD(P)/FAD-dependent oxidoreductase n=1 Tax=Nocardia sp. NPDC048505 TaxID=3155756 RepID=UPI0033EDF402
MSPDYDVIVVGARCAGATTAMLLARKGYRVLAVDRATFPSDTVSTHMIQAPGVALLKQWGLLEPVVAAGTPPIEKYTFDFGFQSGSVRLAGTARMPDGFCTAYAPRRTILDKILVDAAAAAGAEIREGFNVDSLVVESGQVVGIRGSSGGGASVVERARLVVGADGRGSRVARTVAAEQYNYHPKGQYQYYSYWRDLPIEGFEVVIRPGRVWAAQPTNDGLTMLAVAWPIDEKNAYRADIEGNYLRTLELSPEFAERVRAATRVEPFVGAGVENYFRKPYGPGWALVGDAAYNKDPITALGITDAFRGAELLAAAIDQTYTGAAGFDAAMAEYQRIRDTRNTEVFEHTAHLAQLEPASADFERLVRAMQGNQEAIDQFSGINAGLVSPADFFDPANVDRILATSTTAVNR